MEGGYVGEDGVDVRDLGGRLGRDLRGDDRDPSAPRRRKGKKTASNAGGQQNETSVHNIRK